MHRSRPAALSSLLFSLSLAACGSLSQNTSLASLRVACEQGQAWNGSACVPWGPGRNSIAKGESLLDEGQFDLAAQTLASATAQGPHSHATHVRLFEQLGIANAYREDSNAASKAFAKLLMLSPSHLLSYTLSPRATLKFEKARQAVLGKALPSLNVRLPVDNEVSRPVEVDLEVLADPDASLKQATLYVSDSSWRAHASG